MIKPTLETEQEFWQTGLLHVAGIDEVGRGTWAGPVMAAAVILPPDAAVTTALKGVRDSKTLSARQRAAAALAIQDTALASSIGAASVDEINHLGIVAATRLAMLRAVQALPLAPQALIIDALGLPALALPQAAFPYADARSLSVAAASILAKVTRDRWMIEVAEPEYPGYGFAQHKGYGTRQHQEALAHLGVCPLHRVTFRPVALRLNREVMSPADMPAVLDD